MVVFSILMESGKGIADKSPDYILEKTEAVNTCESEHRLLSLLGLKDRGKYENWIQRWGGMRVD
jgi:hypothetical protein